MKIRRVEVVVPQALSTIASAAAWDEAMFICKAASASIPPAALNTPAAWAVKYPLLLVPVELVKNLAEHTILVLNKDTLCIDDGSGKLTFGHITIETDPSEEEEDENYWSKPVLRDWELL